MSSIDILSKEVILTQYPPIRKPVLFGHSKEQKHLERYLYNKLVSVYPELLNVVPGERINYYRVNADGDICTLTVKPVHKLAGNVFITDHELLSDKNIFSVTKQREPDTSIKQINRRVLKIRKIVSLFIQDFHKLYKGRTMIEIAKKDDIQVEITDTKHECFSCLFLLNNYLKTVKLLSFGVNHIKHRGFKDIDHCSPKGDDLLAYLRRYTTPNIGNLL